MFVSDYVLDRRERKEKTKEGLNNNRIVKYAIIFGLSVMTLGAGLPFLAEKLEQSFQKNLEQKIQSREYVDPLIVNHYTRQNLISSFNYNKK